MIQFASTKGEVQTGQIGYSAQLAHNIPGEVATVETGTGSVTPSNQGAELSVSETGDEADVIGMSVWETDNLQYAATFVFAVEGGSYPTQNAAIIGAQRGIDSVSSARSLGLDLKNDRFIVGDYDNPDATFDLSNEIRGGSTYVLQMIVDEESDETIFKLKGENTDVEVVIDAVRAVQNATNQEHRLMGIEGTDGASESIYLGTVSQTWRI